MQDIRIVRVQENALLERGLIVGVIRNAAGIMGMRPADEAGFDLQHVEAPVAGKVRLVDQEGDKASRTGKARIALEELTKRVGTYEIDESEASWVHSVNVRGFAALPTSVEVLR